MNLKQYLKEQKRFLKAQRKRVAGRMHDGDWRRAKTRWLRARYYYDCNKKTGLWRAPLRAS